jgi:hypothetical protein
MTLQKFLSTNQIFKTVDTPTGPVVRTAWALKTKAWPTYMYFSIAATSFFLNCVTLVAYLWSVKRANTFNNMSTIFNTFIAVANLVVWAVAAGLYRFEKGVTEDGKHNDLWGWTCSAAAQSIQHAFQDEVPFDRFCQVQSSSWYAGMVQVGAMLLTVVIWCLAGRRKKTKKVYRNSARDVGGFGHY